MDAYRASAIIKLNPETYNNELLLINIAIFWAYLKIHLWIITEFTK